MADCETRDASQATVMEEENEFEVVSGAEATKEQDEKGTEPADVHLQGGDVVQPQNNEGAERPEPSPAERKTIILIGNTGVGKSTLGNAMLGLDTDCDSLHGFKMSSDVRSCTASASKMDGFWMGDPTMPIRVIDTPGHGDTENRDAAFRQAMVDFLKEERFVHAFVWLKNAQAPKFDKLDGEFYKIFTEMFGAGFLDHLVIVLTRFSFSESAMWSRKKSKTSLETLIKGMRAKLRDIEEEIPIYAIDALHNPENPNEVEKYDVYMMKLWESVQKFGEHPVQNIKVVEDDLAKLQHHLQDLTKQMEESSKQHASQIENMREEQCRRDQETQRKMNDLLQTQRQIQEQAKQASGGAKRKLEMQQAEMESQRCRLQAEHALEQLRRREEEHRAAERHRVEIEKHRNLQRQEQERAKEYQRQLEESRRNPPARRGGGCPLL